MRRVALVALLAAALAFAGCLGGGDDASEAASNQPETQPQDQQVENDTAENETTSDGPDLVWNSTTRDGTVTGAYAGGFAFSQDAGTENWTVREGTRNLTLNLSSQDGTELSMRIAPPGCEGTFDDDCSETVTTEDGQAHWNTTDPDQGKWHVDLFRASNGYGETRYELTIAKLVPAEVLEPSSA